MPETTPATKPDPQPAASVEAKPEEKAPAEGVSSSNSGTNTSPRQASPAQTNGKPEQRSDKSAEQLGSASPTAAVPEEKKGGPQTEAKPDAKPEPRLDPEMKKLVEAQVKAQLEPALESKMDTLLEVNRQLAIFLGEQMEMAIKLRQSVAAMERLIEADARRKGKYAAVLEQVKGEGDGMADPHWINRTRGMLSQLKRTGTTGPKIESETAPAGKASGK